MNRTLTGTTTESNGYERELPIRPSSMTGASQSDRLVSYSGHTLMGVGGWKSYTTAEVQSVYSTTPVNWAGDIPNKNEN